MKCPYRGFTDCIVQECPACNYTVTEHTKLEGRFPGNMSADKAIEMGYAWETKYKKYHFESCKLIEDSVQPVPPKQEVINNNVSQRTSVVVHKSIF